MGVRIFPAARDRLLDIWDYTAESWGDQQADAYVRRIVDRLDQASHQRHLWRVVSDKSLVGVYFLRVEHHYAFFRELSLGELGVLSILHESMDLPSRLKEDLAGTEEP